MFKGTFTALVTPFKNNRVDYEKLEELIEIQIKNKISGISPCGCTGEAATLTHDEQKEVIDFTVSKVRGRVQVVAGTGSNSTAETIELTKYAKITGADGALIITPYYNKPTPDGQIAHYTEIANAAKLPIMLYNVPGRTGLDMQPDTVAKLSKNKYIVAIKEACGRADRVGEILSRCDITVLSGDDGLTLPMIALGAQGAVSVVSNIAPRKTSDMVAAALAGKFDKARKLHYELLPVINALFIETNPIPVKAALNMMGKLNGETRMPLCNMRRENIGKLRAVLKKAKMI